MPSALDDVTVALSVAIVQVDDGLDLVVVINQPNMAANCDVAVIAGRWRQAARQIGRRRVHLSAEVLIEQRYQKFRNMGKFFA